MPRWTQDLKDKMAETIRQRKPWLKSTGPTTEAGKQTVSRNGAKRRQEAPQQTAPEAEPLPQQPEATPVQQAVEAPGGHGGFFSTPAIRRGTFGIKFR